MSQRMNEQVGHTALMKDETNYDGQCVMKVKH